MFQGDTKDLEIRVVDGDNNPLDLTGSTLEWRLYKDVDSPELIYKDLMNDGIDVTDAVGGVFVVRLIPLDTVTGNLHGRYEHEAIVTDVRGYVATVLTGKAFIYENHG